MLFRSHGLLALAEDDADLVEEVLDLFNVLNWDGADPLDRLEVLEDDGHVEVL